MSVSRIARMIAREEGSKRNANGNHIVYPCPADKLTIGYGRNVDPDGGKGLTESEAQYLLRGDVEEVLADLNNIFPFTGQIDGARLGAFADMRFQLGPSRFRGFRKMIGAVPEAVSSGDWTTVAAEAEDSRWRWQTPERALRVIAEILSGNYRPE